MNEWAYRGTVSALMIIAVATGYLTTNETKCLFGFIFPLVMML